MNITQEEAQDLADIQARLDSYKTNKQRAQRLQELRLLAKAQDGTVRREDAIEAGALFCTLKAGRPVPLELVVKKMQEAYADGRLTGYDEH